MALVGAVGVVTPDGPEGTRSPVAAAQARRTTSPGFDVSKVIETVEHHLAKTEDGAMHARDSRYRLSLDDSGFRLSLGHPGGGAAPDFGVLLEQIRVGQVRQPLRPAAWRGKANVATRHVGGVFSERVTARDGHVEWDIVVEERPGPGDLVVEAGVQVPERLASSEPRMLQRALAWNLGAGRSLRMGEVVVVDASGRRLYRAVPEVVGTKVRLTVPHRVLARASYPLVVDPVISPESSASDPAEIHDSEPAVAVNNAGVALVAWRSRPASGGVRLLATRVRLGEILDLPGIALDDDESAPGKVAVTTNGSEFLAVWPEARTIHYRRVDGGRITQGTLDLFPPAAVEDYDADVVNVAVAWASEAMRYLVVWEQKDAVSPRTTAMRGALLNAEGSRTYPPEEVWRRAGGFPISSGSNDLEAAPAVASDGSGFLVAWSRKENSSTQNAKVYLAVVTGDGAVLQPGGIPLNNLRYTRTKPSVAWNGVTYFVTWHDSRPQEASVQYPAIFTGKTVLIDKQSYVLGAGVTSSGVILDNHGIEIASGACADGAAAPVARVGGTAKDVVVVWNKEGATTCKGDLFATRVDVDGYPREQRQLTFDPGSETATAVASNANGDLGLVVWQQTPSEPGRDDIFGMWLTSPSDPPGPFLISRHGSP